MADGRSSAAAAEQAGDRLVRTGLDHGQHAHGDRENADREGEDGKPPAPQCRKPAAQSRPAEPGSRRVGGQLRARRHEPVTGARSDVLARGEATGRHGAHRSRLGDGRHRRHGGTGAAGGCTGEPPQLVVRGPQRGEVEGGADRRDDARDRGADQRARDSERGRDDGRRHGGERAGSDLGSARPRRPVRRGRDGLARGANGCCRRHGRGGAPLTCCGACVLCCAGPLGVHPASRPVARGDTTSGIHTGGVSPVCLRRGRTLLPSRLTASGQPCPPAARAGCGRDRADAVALREHRSRPALLDVVPRYALPPAFAAS